MSEGKLKHFWQPFAVLTALTANANRDAKKRPEPYDYNDFLPLRYREKLHSDVMYLDKKATLAILKKTFVKKRRRK